MVDGFFKNLQDIVTGSESEDEYSDRPVQPASEDPYGDPADQYGGQYGDLTPASQDPYGDPADQYGGQYGDLTPASQDPYGDPADQGEEYIETNDPYGDPADQQNY